MLYIRGNYTGVSSQLLQSDMHIPGNTHTGGVPHNNHNNSMIK